jgi:hypothetical protein
VHLGVIQPEKSRAGGSSSAVQEEIQVYFVMLPANIISLFLANLPDGEEMQ